VPKLILKPTRRHLLALSLLTPLLASGTALADDDQDFRPGRRPLPAAIEPARLELLGSTLITMPQSGSSGDFNSGNGGSDPLSSGRAVLRPNDGRVEVALRGAASGASYEVFFQSINTGKGREDLGAIGPTDSAGNLDAVSPNMLSGSNRVGVFILARSNDNSAQAGKDEFISSVSS